MSENRTHPQDEYHPLFTDRKCPVCRHTIGVPCDLKNGRNVELKPGDIQLCANCCCVSVTDAHGELKKATHKLIMRLVVSRGEDAYKAFAGCLTVNHRQIAPFEEQP